MKNSFAKKGLLILVVLAFTSAVAVAKVEAPAKINLKTSWNIKSEGKPQKDVVFDHVLHQKDNKCTDKCHATDEGGKFTPPGEIKGTNEKNAAHKFCWTGCHIEKKVSVGKTCKKCHKE
ncbi:MAG: cytochrome C [Deferribacteraceae bacterium]|nr:cytochrome C [Deferribacteraceae bacterium]